MIAPNKFDSYQISIKKVGAPVATIVVPNYTIKQGKSTISFRNEYRVTFWNTCGFYEDLPMTCYFCSDEQLIETARDLVIARNVAICNQIPTYMIFQIIES